MAGGYVIVSEAMRGRIKGKDLLEWRNAHGWTRPEAAKELGLPSQTYKNYETDKRTIPTVVQVAMRACG